MEKQKQLHRQAPGVRIPQLKVRSNVSAGGSLQSCQEDLAYWQQQYAKMCGHL